ncbi:MAG: V-type ATPase subunit, partial [Oscillospiraceae bacterium]
MNSKIKDTDYLFISANLRARESKLLNQERMERMLASNNPQDAAKVLEECGFGDMSEIGPTELDSRLASYRGGLFSELRRIVPDPSLVDVFLIRYDYHNAKVLIKAEAAKTDGYRLLSDSGRIPPSVLADAYTRDELGSLPEDLAGAIKEARDILNRTGNPQLSDFAVDKAYFKQLLSLSQALGSPFLDGYVRLQIDSANLRTVVRSVRMGKDQAFIQNALIPGGTADEKALAAAALSKSELAPLFGSSCLAEAAHAGASVLSGGRLTEFERLCDNALTAYISKARWVSFGEHPVIAFIFAVESSITAARIIMMGLYSGLKP